MQLWTWWWWYILIMLIWIDELLISGRWWVVICIDSIPIKVFREWLAWVLAWLTCKRNIRYERSRQISVVYLSSNVKKKNIRGSVFVKKPLLNVTCFFVWKKYHKCLRTNYSRSENLRYKFMVISTNNARKNIISFQQVHGHTEDCRSPLKMHFLKSQIKCFFEG